MQSSELIQEKLQDLKKNVTFSLTAKDSESVEFTPSYQKTKKRLNYTSMKKKVLGFLLSGKYEELNSLLRTYIPQEIENFFLEKGKVIFSWAVVESSDDRILDFLTNTVSSNVSYQILSSDNFSILNSFFDVQKSMEKYKIYSESEKDLALKKLTIIKKIGNEQINQFIENNMIEPLKNFQASKKI